MRRRKLHGMQPQNMDPRIDFLRCIESDVSLHIMSFLDDPADIVRASAVSRFWHRFGELFQLVNVSIPVIANALAKQACLKRIPGVVNIVGTAIMYKSQRTIDSVEVESKENEWEILERDQKAYASLLLAITKSTVYPVKSHPRDGWFCMHDAISASSTDNYPAECILNTMHPYDTFFKDSDRASYWSSKGQSNPDVPETLIYKLRTRWVVTEIDIRPFKDFFQPGHPIYSAKYVRFRIGHLKSPREFEKYSSYLLFEEPTDDKFGWTYVSPEFPMVQENRLQPFKLPEPVLCIDAYLQIELLGRVQRHEKDGLFYLCMSYVQVLGRPLSPAFGIEVTEPDREPFLKYCPKKLNFVLKKYPLFQNRLREDEWYDRLVYVEESLRL